MGMKRRSNKKSKKHKRIDESDSEKKNLDRNENTEYSIKNEAPFKW